ncbi:hypothetical protein [Ruminococcus sp. Marseille-P6503]|uniref:hypothetical protein n=1 Tax=Ruminococcus sp. Marseille-P6503 TaxID=2364796 RepID=UPI000F5227B5|nr:hypothetical protein [Ruminococcus sp. Marseille-P6503]
MKVKKILLDNALESWSIAIKYCKYIKNGLSTLHYKKTFVSSLHNSIELFFKQIMLDKEDKTVIDHIVVKNEDIAKLQLEFYQTKNLNKFFEGMDAKHRNKFYSIEFSRLVDKNKLIKPTLDRLGIQSIKEELELLQELRNHETHFYISSLDYLSEVDFVKIHNLMKIIYEIIEDNDFLPYWGEPSNEYRHLEFKEKDLKKFSYIEALKSSPITQSIVTVLNGKQHFYFEENPFNLTEQYFEELVEQNESANHDFNDVLSIITLLKQYGLLHFIQIGDYEEFEGENGELFYSQVYYVIEINI